MGLVDLAQPLATLVGVAAILVGGGWAAFQYRKARTSANAQWLVSLYRDFYIESRLARARIRIEDRYETDFAPLVQDWISGRRRLREASQWHLEIEQDLDLVLNFLEMLAHLEQSGEIPSKDLMALFEYWLTEVIGSPDRPALRLYIQMFGYERLHRLILDASVNVGRVRRKADTDLAPLEDPLRVAVYGSLVPGSTTWDHFKEFAAGRGVDDIEQHIRIIGPTKIEGTLLDLGSYPGLKLGPGLTSATLISLDHVDTLDLLDDYEEVRPGPGPGYYRDFIDVADSASTGGGRGAWVYLWRGPVSEDRHVLHGDWDEHLASRPQQPPDLDGL